MIYFMQAADGGPVKIGFTDNLRARHKSLESHYRKSLVILATMDGDRADEGRLHQRFAHLRLGRTEQFRPSMDLMTFIGRPLLAGANPDAVIAMPGVEERQSITTLKGSSGWAAWVARLAKHDRNTVAGLIDRALTEYAINHGFSESPPER